MIHVVIKLKSAGQPVLSRIKLMRLFASSRSNRSVGVPVRRVEMRSAAERFARDLESPTSKLGQVSL
jgi:hypothetical protein